VIDSFVTAIAGAARGDVAAMGPIAPRGSLAATARCGAFPPVFLARNL